MAVARSVCLALACCVPAAALKSRALGAAREEPAAEAGGGGSGYFWPSGHGVVGRYSNSPYMGPKNLSASLAWSWHHPSGRFHTLTFGTAIDDKKNIYLTASDAIRKFSPNGTLLWTFPAGWGKEFPNAGTLMDGAFYTSATDGRVIAIDMETGKQAWSNHASLGIDGTNGFVSAHAGVVVAGTHSKSSNTKVSGFDARTGNKLWSFAPDAPVWNFLASFPGDGTFTFQDLEGRAYRCSLKDGSLIWKAGGVKGTWTDGSSLLGPNGVVYTVNTFAGQSGFSKSLHGSLNAYNLSDGGLLWNFTTPMPPNNLPAIGRLGRSPRLSVVQPIGQQVLKGAPTDVYAFDAETGAVQWIFKGPSQQGPFQAGETQGVKDRMLAGRRPMCLPNPWSAPSIDAAGTVYIGNEEGNFYALADKDGNGHVEGEGEVSSYNTGACFAGSAGPSHAPGMVVIASCDTMFVFQV
mmetsp:Transcript_118339/g.382015  ORF Transcript_118339/g.382015 Transcript_118339/m.382015 type:complete len:463 (+) Transcript_118339:70-1458(+)